MTLFRQRNKLEQVREQLLSSGSRKGNVYPPVIVQLDLEELNELEAKMETALSVYGHIDILVNNGGISFRGEITSTTLEVDVRLMKTNYFGAVALTKALLPSMIQRRSGHVVMIGSVQSKIAIPFRFVKIAIHIILQLNTLFVTLQVCICSFKTCLASIQRLPESGSQPSQH